MHTLDPPDRAGRASAQSMRLHNRALVLTTVAAHRGWSRAQLADNLGLSRATVSSLVEDLIADHLLHELAADRNGRGRPALPLELNPNGPAALGIELGVDHATAVVLDLTGTIRARQQTSLGRTPAPATTLRRLVAISTSIIAASGLAVTHGAVAVPGLIDRSTVIRRLPNINGWQDRDLAGELGLRLGLTLRADNEANLAALADLRGGTVGTDFLHVSGEIGVGAALVVDGRLFRGARGFAGELGHTVVDAQGPVCGCGARGCLEQFVGRDALLRATGAGSIDAIVALAEQGDRGTLSHLEDAGLVLGVALADAVNLLDVPSVVLGGTYARLFPWLAPPIRGRLDSHVLSRIVTTTELFCSPHGVDAAVVGAALDVVDDILAARVPARPRGFAKERA